MIQHRFSTRNHPYFTFIYDSWYKGQQKKNENKVLPDNIESLLTEISLAFLIMGDGYWENDSKTESFLYVPNLFLYLKSNSL